MTVAQKSTLKSYLPVIINLSTFITIIALSINYGASQNNIQKDIIEAQKDIISNRLNLEVHSASEILHKSSDDLNVKFVPRKELEVQLGYIMKTQDEIKDLLKKKQ